jgi:hypothetical protein
MKSSKNAGTDPTLTRGEKKARKAYQPPKIIYQEPLEAIAGVCSAIGKAEPVGCPNQISS